MGSTSKVSSKQNISSRYAKAKRYGRRAMVILVLILIALVVLGLCGFRFAYATMLPDVIEMSEQEATEVLEDYNMQVEIQRDWSDSYEEGMVMKQEPQGGSHVSSGDTVTIVVSKGSQSASMPDLEGLGKEEIISILDSSGIAWMISEIYSDEVETGMIISQSPEAGAEVLPEGRVIVVISKGEEPEIRTSSDVTVVRGNTNNTTTSTSRTTTVTEEDDEEDTDDTTITTVTSSQTTQNNAVGNTDYSTANDETADDNDVTTDTENTVDTDNTAATEEPDSDDAADVDETE